MSRNELRDIVQDNLKVKVDNPTVSYGWLGNTAGVVDIPGPYGWVWVRMIDGSLQKAYDVITPHKVGYPVKCGYDPYVNNGLLKVLEAWIAPQANGSVPTSPAVVPHHASHEWLNSNGGGDVVLVRMRAFMPLRPEVVPPFGIYIEPDLQFINGVWTAVGGSTIDLSSYVPGYTSGSALQERFVLIYMDSTSGSIVAASGSTVTSGSLTMNMVPTFTASQFPICIVHLYTTQAKINEAIVPGTDLADVRWGMFRASGSATSSGGMVASGSVTDGHLAVWNGTSGSSLKDGGTPSSSSYSATAPIHVSGSVISHDTTTVVSGSYTNLNATIDEFGHITAASNGTSGSGGGSGIYPQRATMWHDELLVISGGSYSTYYRSGQFHGFNTEPDSASNGDTFTNGFIASSGSYTLSTLGVAYSDGGKLDWYVDNTLVSSGLDFHGSGLVLNVKYSNSIYIPTSGRHVLKGVTNGTNASGYNIRLTSYWLSPATDTTSV